jgi:hypothetical protein
MNSKKPTQNQPEQATSSQAAAIKTSNLSRRELTDAEIATIAGGFAVETCQAQRQKPEM